MKEFWEIIELKGIPIWKAISILENYGYKLFIYPYTGRCFEELGRKNKKAIEEAIIELNYTA